MTGTDAGVSLADQTPTTSVIVRRVVSLSRYHMHQKAFGPLLEDKILDEIVGTLGQPNQPRLPVLPLSLLLLQPDIVLDRYFSPLLTNS